MLTEQKRKYAHARAAGQGKRNAALTAGSTETSAKVSASRWERDAEVQAYMLKLGFTPEVATAKAQPNVSVPPNEDARPSDAAAADRLAERAELSPDNYSDPVEYMKALVNTPTEDPKLRLDAAKAWDASLRGHAQAKGKKEENADKAKQAAGKFAISKSPTLKAVK